MILTKTKDYAKWSYNQWIREIPKQTNKDLVAQICQVKTNLENFETKKMKKNNFLIDKANNPLFNKLCLKVTTL